MAGLEKLEKFVLKRGNTEQKPTPDATLSVHYTCCLAASGEEIDSSRGVFVSECDGIVVRKSQQPMKFVVGDGSQIEGFEAAVSSLCLGERALFSVPAEGAYGAAGKGAVPPNAELSFDIQLCGIDGVYCPASALKDP